MRRQAPSHLLERERAIAEGISDVAAELRLVDAVDYVAQLRLGLLANVGDLVHSAAELYFRNGTLRFGGGGDIDLAWGRAPVVTLDMEFVNSGVTAYFRLVLEAERAGVEISYITFADADADPAANTARLIAAIADARLVPAPGIGAVAKSAG